jgi:hypothetical protein
MGFFPQIQGGTQIFFRMPPPVGLLLDLPLLQKESTGCSTCLIKTEHRAGLATRLRPCDENRKLKPIQSKPTMEQFQARFFWRGVLDATVFLLAAFGALESRVRSSRQL